MNTYTFTQKDVLDQVKNLAAERPDFVYTEQEGIDSDSGCSYLGANTSVPGGEGCIVGQALTRLGVSNRDLQRQEGISADGALKHILNISEMDRHYDEESALALAHIQEQQDDGQSWGDAVSSV